MAGDGIKNLSQTTTSSADISQMYMMPQQDVLNALAQVLNSEHSGDTLDCIATILDNSSNSSLDQASIQPGVLSQTNQPPLVLEAQVKSEPIDNYSSSCCASMSSRNVYGQTMPAPFESYPSEIPTTCAMDVTVKVEPTSSSVQQTSSGSRKPRKGKIGKDSDKKERRKAQNRKAAKNYREKQKNKKEQVENDYGLLIADNAEKQQMIANLSLQLKELQQIFEDHKQRGGCRIAASGPQMNQTSQQQTISTNNNNNIITTTTPAPRIPQPIDIPSFPLGMEKEKAPQVPPYTPNSEQSFGFEVNIYSPQSDEKMGGRDQVYSPLEDQNYDVDFSSPESVEVFNSLENPALVQQSSLLDLNQWHDTLDYLR